MIDKILSETICRFCSCALFSNIYCKINFIAKMALTYAISIDFWEKNIKKYVLLSSLMYIIDVP